MKKVGIITLYYKNDNYGGVAQAYALNKYLLDMGCDCELISYLKEKSTLGLAYQNSTVKTILKRIINKIKNSFITFVEKFFKKRYEDLLKMRAKKLDDFRNSIPHSKVYTYENINEIADKYDYFVTGSDQCWNPSVITGSFVFDFLNGKDKKIFSYASSIAVDTLSTKYEEYMKENLKKYQDISVREKDSAVLLEKAIGKRVEVVIDPTLLLEQEEWDEVTSGRIIEGDYVFSYILGNDKSTRTKAIHIAKKKKMKLVTVPYIRSGNQFAFKIVDYKFGDVQMIDISFNDFLALIKYANLVVTDSFHAICFSYIFKREFVAFEKKGLILTSSRIKTLLNVMDIPDRMISNAADALNINSINYEKVNQKLEKFKKESKEYIKKAIKS